MRISSPRSSRWKWESRWVGRSGFGREHAQETLAEYDYTKTIRLAANHDELPYWSAAARVLAARREMPGWLASRPGIVEPISDLGHGRIAAMDDAGVDLAVLSLAGVIESSYAGFADQVTFALATWAGAGTSTPRRMCCG